MRKIPKYEPDIQVFRTQLWIQHNLWSRGLTIEEFAELALEHEARLAVVIAWRAGKYRATPQSVAKIARRLPGSEHPFRLPLFGLTGDIFLTEKAIHRILNPYYSYSEESGYRYVVPPFNSLKLINMAPWKNERYGFFEQLVHRADIHAFTLLLGLFRIAQARRDGYSQLSFLPNLYRLIPAIERLPWIWPNRAALRWCVTKLHEVMLIPTPTFEVDFDVLDRLSVSWYEHQDNFLPYWHKIEWGASVDDPIVPYDCKLRRRVSGKRFHVKARSDFEFSAQSMLCRNMFFPGSLERERKLSGRR